MHRFLAAALFAIALAGVALMAGPGARAETAIIEVVRDMGKIQLAQIWRERDITNCYLERIRRYLHMGQRGDAYALREIGFHYSKGWGVIRDLTKADMWFTLPSQPNFTKLQITLAASPRNHSQTDFLNSSFVGS